jgi:hypothetical protein
LPIVFPPRPSDFRPVSFLGVERNTTAAARKTNSRRQKKNRIIVSISFGVVLLPVQEDVLPLVADESVYKRRERRSRVHHRRRRRRRQHYQHCRRK